LKLGVIAPLTGLVENGDNLGQGFANGAILAQEEYQESGSNPKVTLAIEDDNYDSKKGMSAYQKLVSVDNVNSLINLSSPTMIAVGVARPRAHGQAITRMPQSQVQTALANVRDLWLQSSVMDFNDRKAEEIAKIDYMERKQWEVIRLINNDAVMREEDGGMTELGFRRIKHAQDTIMWCIQMRTKIFGLEAPIKVDWRFEAKKYGIDADLMYHTLVAQFADQIIDAETVTFKELPAPKDYEGEDDEGEDDEDSDANTDSD
jgi:hypothetical protein